MPVPASVPGLAGGSSAAARSHCAPGPCLQNREWSGNTSFANIKEHIFLFALFLSKLDTYGISVLMKD